MCAVFGDRIGFRIIYPSDHLDSRGLDFTILTLALRLHDVAFDPNRTPGAEPDEICVVVQRLVGHHLQAIEARAVMQTDEREAALGGTQRTNPTGDANR